MRKFVVFTILLASFALSALSQDRKKEEILIDYQNPKTYIIGGVKVEGISYLGEEQIISMTGLVKGNEITVPSETLSSVVKLMWEQRYFSNVALYVDSLSPTRDTAFFVLELQERPRVSQWSFKGVRNTEQTDLMEKLNLRRGASLSEYLIRQSTEVIKDYYKEKGFLKAEVNVIQTKDTIIKDAIRVTLDVDRGEKVKIGQINFSGYSGVKESKLVSSMKKTRDRRLQNFFKSKKFKEDEFVNDKASVLRVFNEMGYRDARIVKDSMYYMADEDNKLAIDIEIDQGRRYYYRNISWTGNSLYTEDDLNRILMINKGDIYDMVTLDKRLNGDPKRENMDVASLYRNQGYLFYNIIPVETNIVGDSVDVEIRMMEGKPATFNNIIIKGNTITNERVVRRQIFTNPGSLYSQADLERSIREISSMGHFDAEHAMDPSKGFSIIPNPASNTVDVTYNVSEKSNSQVELSGGWGANTFVGTVGLSFNNFSISKLFQKEAWKPIPLGDAQVFSIRAQTNGRYYSSFSASFMEPWLTGKKPVSLSVSAYYSKNTPYDAISFLTGFASPQFMETFGVAASLGSRLKWPDNYFVLRHELSWQTYHLNDWMYDFIFTDGVSHNLSYKISLNRNSTDQPIFPRQGSDFQFSVQLTPPYSLFRGKDTDYSTMSDQDKYRWIEYHKWTFKGTTYTQLFGDLILMTRAQFGFLGSYNSNLGYSPFEGYLVGGDGMSGYNTYGSEIIALRGYGNYTLTPRGNDGVYKGRVYDKFSLELRYPIILQPQSTIFALAFLEGGNSWENIQEFNPFDMKRSAGLGLRIMLPMIGLLGIDWGWGFDEDRVTPGVPSGSQFHFIIGQQF